MGSLCLLSDGGLPSVSCVTHYSFVRSFSPSCTYFVKRAVPWCRVLSSVCCVVGFQKKKKKKKVAPMGGCGGHLKGGKMGARAAASRCFS